LKNLGLTYCTNVHPLGEWAAWSDLIGRFGPAIRADLGWGNLPMGLWFPASLIAEMNRDPEVSRERLKALLRDRNLSAFTCNAFPYGNFHDKVVKTKVYHPDWTTPERLAYSVACARLLASLLREGSESGEGSVSTLPLGWRIGWSEDHSRRAADNLCAFVREARAIAEVQGRTIRLGLEPEPGCALETIDQVLAFWDRHLRPAAARAGIAPADLANHLGLCYDTCHQAIQFEDAIEVLDRLHADGIAIVKMQLSSGLVFLPDPERKTLELRRQFVEERFLHQTRVRTPAGIICFDDLPEALAADRGAIGGIPSPGPLPGSSQGIDLWAHPWRVHFHLPIDSQSLLDSEAISTTRDDMLKAYHHAVARGLCRHFEIETYTWSVLPEAHRPKDDADLARSLAREIRFIEAMTPAGSTVAHGATGNEGKTGNTDV
jgi:sugar phosphate isomerase/epimerase